MKKRELSVWLRHLNLSGGYHAQRSVSAHEWLQRVGARPFDRNAKKENGITLGYQKCSGLHEKYSTGTEAFLTMLLSQF